MINIFLDSIHRYVSDMTESKLSKVGFHDIIYSKKFICYVQYTNRLWLFINVISSVVYQDFDIIYNDITKIIRQ